MKRKKRHNYFKFNKIKHNFVDDTDTAKGSAGNNTIAEDCETAVTHKKNKV